MSSTLTISDYHTLLALHRAIIEAKFAEASMQTELMGSPFLARAASQLVDALKAKENELGMQDSFKRWKEWQEINPNRKEWYIAVNYIASHASIWNSWDNTQREEFVQVVASPYNIIDDLLYTFISEVNDAVSRALESNTDEE